MEFQLKSVKRPADKQHQCDKSNLIATALKQKNTSYGQKRWKKPTIAYNISKSRYSFFLISNNINLIYIYH